MRVLRFSVEGYKNLTARIDLRDLDAVTAIYGPNNVGKSNLLEALGLPFALMETSEQGRLPLGGRFSLSPQVMSDLGYPFGEIINLSRPTPISLEIDVEIGAEEWASAGLASTGPVAAAPLSLALRIDVGPSGPAWTVTRFLLSDGTDLAAGSAGSAEAQRATPYAQFLAGRVLTGGAWTQVRRIQAIHVHRGAPGCGRGVVPAALKLALYDCQESTVRVERRRWVLFRTLVGQFEDITGAREVRAVFNRKENSAEIVLERGDALLPLHLMGTGVQQLITLCGTLATSGASVAVIEEPEANLSFKLQLRLREALRGLAGGETLSQILFTTHSPGFQAGPDFYAMRPGAAGPELVRAPSEQLPLVTGLAAEGAEPATGSAPRSWVTEDGLVRLPENVIEGLGISQGGGVSFLQNADGTFRILTDEQALSELGWDEA